MDERLAIELDEEDRKPPRPNALMVKRLILVRLIDKWTSLNVQTRDCFADEILKLFEGP